MPPRANWKGFLKIAELTCPVALYAAASSSERISLHTLNRKTGCRVRRQFVDQETGDAVESDQQVKGYEVGQGDYVFIEPGEIAAAVPESDKTLAVQAFIPCDGVDDVYFDRPYYLAPASPVAEQAFAVIRQGMQHGKVAALARAVLFRRVRSLLIRAHGPGLIASTLHFDYEVRSAKEAFAEIPEVKIEGEMLDLAKHIIATKTGVFDPRAFHDRYEAALAELVRAKIEGKPLAPRKAPAATNVVDLMEALRRSAGLEPPAQKSSARKTKAGAGKTTDGKKGAGATGKNGKSAGKTAARTKRPAGAAKTSRKAG